MQVLQSQTQPRAQPGVAAPALDVSRLSSDGRQAHGPAELPLLREGGVPGHTVLSALRLRAAQADALFAVRPHPNLLSFRPSPPRPTPPRPALI